MADQLGDTREFDGAGGPLCIIETTEVFVRAFDEVDAAFAAEEGECDRVIHGGGVEGSRP